MSNCSKFASIITDEKGYLSDSNEWQENIALKFAEQEKLILAVEHWQLIYALRKFYENYERVPTMRAWIKFLTVEITDRPLDSAYFYGLFPEGLKQICKIAGLPKPSHCL